MSWFLACAAPERRPESAWQQAGAPARETAGFTSPVRADLGRRCPSDATRAAQVTLAGLLGEMVDLARLARLPSVPYTTALASSHNRASDAAAPGSKDWFANRDVIALSEAEPATLLDVRGPGTITRIWSANPAGALRVYVDDAATPAIDADFARLLRGEVAPFTPPYAFVAAGGHNLYFPIAFARHVRVALTGHARALFYHVAYRRYPPGTAVQPYGADALAHTVCTRAEVARRLSSSARADASSGAAEQAASGASDTDAAAASHAFTLSTTTPNARYRIAAAPGGSVLLWLRARPARADPGALRGTVLQIAFDGVETVRAPLGDFFALGPGADAVASLPVSASRGQALHARWPMPFAREASVAIAAAGPLANDVAFEALAVAAPFDERSLYFHAQWRAPETFPSKPHRDHTLAQLMGPGLYAGNVLNVVNRNAAWWGEGDEKIYVDGERFPSHFGTGTEDYYGYAWCSNERFSTAYVGQPASGERASFGASTLYRFHVLDPIPFQTALRFDLEVRHWGEAVPVTYDALHFWYARPAARGSGMAVDPAAFAIPALDAPAPPDVPAGPYVCGP